MSIAGPRLSSVGRDAFLVEVYMALVMSLAPGFRVYIQGDSHFAKDDSSTGGGEVENQAH